ncbi:aspartic proteinase nepenthesin-2-like [Quillaja saponaria]|uniref:Aspartic proteinase nepenthesin-2-like n=1 Tax=Quillaja saponaria TaxID=32244 RepID=A0AAD7L0B3_QUISA|nr:aspartic proteinase nepenthesin-2-like [Quillaja saponaria]
MHFRPSINQTVASQAQALFINCIMDKIQPCLAVIQPLLFLVLIIVSQFHFTISKTGFSLRLIPRDSPESPLYPGNLSRFEQIERLIKFSNARAHYIESLSGSNATVEPDNIRFTLLRDNFFYMVQIGIGSQGTLEFLLMDTGSGLTWVQCQPCRNCYPQVPQFPIYDSRTSNSYRKLPCSHPLCNGPSPLFQCVNNECIYSISYSGGAVTKGVASLETFRVLSSATTTTLINDIIFGCSSESQGVQFAKNGVISGILGLSWSRDSFVTQLFDRIERKFSYCLVPFVDAMMSPSVLRFGSDIPLPSGNVRTTPFVTVPGPALFHLNLIDISVGFKRLGFPPDTFKYRQGGSGGCIIDSGVLIPRLDQNANGQNAYRRVMGEFQRHYDSLQLQRMTQVPQGFQLCYKQPSGFDQFASMTYHFQGAEYVVQGKYMNFYDTQAGYFCVALMPGNGKTSLGAWHQQNKRIIYDGNIRALQFSVETCANDNP